MIPILRASDAGELKRRVMNRSQLQNEEVSRIVKEIVARVRQEGDAALFDYTAKFDHVTMTAETVLVTKDEIARAYAAASPEWLDAMREAARRITAFHEKQKQNTWLNFDPAISLGQKITPLKRVGVYVPGGTAAYPSSVLMNVLPAKVAGVKEIVMVTPPGRDRLGQLPACPCRGGFGGCRQNLQSRRRAGRCRPRVRHREHPPRGQNHRAGQHFCRQRETGGFRACRH